MMGIQEQVGRLKALELLENIPPSQFSNKCIVANNFFMYLKRKEIENLYVFSRDEHIYSIIIIIIIIFSP